MDIFSVLLSFGLPTILAVIGGLMFLTFFYEEVFGNKVRPGLQKWATGVGILFMIFGVVIFLIGRSLEASSISAHEQQLQAIITSSSAREQQLQATITSSSAHEQQLQATITSSSAREQQLQATITSSSAREQQLQTTITAMEAGTITSNLPCLYFLEENGQVVIEAEHFTASLPGRLHSTGRSERDARHITWQNNTNYPGTLQALPDIEATNTMSETNGPALLYSINFTTAGKYYIYLRGLAPSDDSDSIHIGFNGDPITINSFGFSLLREPREPNWVSRDDRDQRLSINVPTAGIYTFYIWMRENGVIVDKIWLDVGQDKVANGDITPNPSESSCKRG